MKRASYLLITLFLSACSSTSSISIVSNNRPYELGSKPFHVESYTYVSNNETKLYLRINRDDLLYTRETADSPFISNFSVSIGEETHIKSDTLKTESLQWLNINFPVSSPTDKSYIIFEFADLNRKVSEKLYSEKRDYIIHIQEDSSEKTRVANPHNIEIGTKVDIESDGVQSWEVYLAEVPKKLPAPPFSGSRSPMDTVKARPFSISDGTWTVQPGCHFFYNSATNKTFIIHGRRSEFPKCINVEDLLECTRYIATRDEYNRLLNSVHPKLALDQFWLDCAGTPDKARNLIRIYYDRVEEANTFFSGLQEGWRTDRGMVHIVMGIPDRVRRDGWREVWLYGEEGNPNSITFVFNRRSQDLDGNIFILERNHMYRTSWDRMVTSWRNGRIHGD